MYKCGGHHRDRATLLYCSFPWVETLVAKSWKTWESCTPHYSSGNTKQGSHLFMWRLWLFVAGKRLIAGANIQLIGAEFYGRGELSSCRADFQVQGPNSWWIQAVFIVLGRVHLSVNCISAEGCVYKCGEVELLAAGCILPLQVEFSCEKGCHSSSGPSPLLLGWIFLCLGRVLPCGPRLS